MTRRLTTALLATTVALASACATSAPQNGPDSDRIQGANESERSNDRDTNDRDKDDEQTKDDKAEDDEPLEGVGEFEFSADGGPSIDVFYATSGEDLRNAEIVFVHHGTGRNAEEYRDYWVPVIKGHNAIVIAPEFDDDDFADAEGYNLGGLVDPPGEKESGQYTSFGYVEPLFREVVDRVGGTQTNFDMFGHSAGAQFVHRYVEFAPQTAVGTAVAANAGWYTMPDASVEFPYGMKEAPVSPDPKTYLTRDLLVLLGEEDVDADDDNLRTEPEAMEQGATRLERGKEFFARGQETAKSTRTELAWRMQTVPGVEHDGEQMSTAAGELILDK